MLSLTHSPITKFTYRGKDYDVDLAFDTVLLYMEMQQDSDLSPFEKWQQSCKLFFHEQELPVDPKFYEQSFKQILKIITDSPYGLKENDDNENGGADTLKQFDYKRDAGAIYASFFAQYGIDLNKERGKMHWDIFKALFDGLGPKTYFQRILDIRRQDLSKIEDTQARQDLADAQNYYAVNGSKTEKEREKEAFNTTATTALFNSLLSQAKKGGN